MNKDPQIYLKDILKALESIEFFVKDMNFDAFQRDDRTSSAVIRKFEIIGEAAKQLSDNFRREYPHVPWKEMAGLRDRLIHQYLNIDFRLVWDTIQNRLPELRVKIKSIIEKQ